MTYPHWGYDPSGRAVWLVPIEPERVVGPSEGIARSERVEVVDSIRGVALLGIVVMNVALYRTGSAALLSSGDGRFGAEISVLSVGLAALVEGRFYPLFSFLFGWGFAAQEARFRRVGANPTWSWLRRSSGLLVLGLLHYLLLFEGDILITYALLGSGLFIAYWIPSKWLVGLGLGAVTFSGGTIAMISAFLSSSSEVRATEFHAQKVDHLRYADGPFGELVAHRLGELPWIFLFSVFTGGTILGMMLLGVAAGRAGLADCLKWPRWIRRWVTPTFFGGLVLGIPLVWLIARASRGEIQGGLNSLAQLGYLWLGPCLALGWAMILVVSSRRDLGHKLLSFVAPLGQMSLTGYLSQSLVACLVFPGFALGWSSTATLLQAELMVLGLWLIEVLLARVWMKRFERGPVEALLRGFTYWRIPRLK